MSEAKPKKEMTQLEQYNAWKTWWKTADKFYERAAQFALTMEHDPRNWNEKREYYQRMLKKAKKYEEETTEELSWNNFCSWNEEKIQKRMTKKVKEEVITGEVNN